MTRPSRQRLFRVPCDGFEDEIVGYSVLDHLADVDGHLNPGLVDHALDDGMGCQSFLVVLVKRQ